jgi:hypothetical protein
MADDENVLRKSNQAHVAVFGFLYGKYSYRKFSDIGGQKMRDLAFFPNAISAESAATTISNVADLLRKHCIQVFKPKWQESWQERTNSGINVHICMCLADAEKTVLDLATAVDEIFLFPNEVSNLEDSIAEDSEEAAKAALSILKKKDKKKAGA